MASAQLNARFSMDRSGGCSPLVINFTNQTTGASANAVYKWDYGNGNTSALASGSAVYADEQSYTVTLTVEDGGNTATSSQQVTVSRPPTVDFSVAPVKTCLGMPVTFTANATPGDGSIANYTWDFGDGSTQQNYSNGQPHTYGVQLTASVSLTVTNSNGCHTTRRKADIVKIIPPLTSTFTADKKVLCLITDPIQFTNSSTGPGTLDYQWSFGDGNGSTQLNPTYIFNKKGIYTVSLKVHSSEGCTVTTTQPSPVNVASYTTDFTVSSPICLNSAVTFNAQNSPAADNSQWEIDGTPWYNYGSLSTSFNTVGDHTIALKNTFGACPQAMTKLISVKDVPHPTPFSIDITGKCGSPVPVNFKDATPGAVNWSWNFNYYGYPGGTAATQTPTFNYTADGYYTVWLQVTNADGCIAFTAQTLQITRPSVSIYADPPSLSQCSSLITFTFHTNASEPLTAAQWNFGDGGTSTSLSPTHGFTNTGSYQVTLNYTTQSGCKGSVTYPINSQTPPNPVAVYTTPAYPATCNQPVTVDFVSVSSEPLTTTNWTFGDPNSGNNTATSAAPSHKYNVTGKYVAQLTYVTQSGCKGMAYSNVIIIDPKITALDFTMNPSPVCGSNPVAFSATPNSYDINTYNWEFGDGGVLFGAMATSHSYMAPGNYTVKLYARNMGGCDTTMTKIITVKPPFPQITDITNTCMGNRGDVTFTQTSVQATTVVWNFGDGQTSTTPGTQASITHNYKKTGTYNVTLAATNGQCTLTTPADQVKVLIKQNPQLTANVSSACSNTLVNVQITNLDKNPFQTDVVYDYNYYTSYDIQGVKYGDGTDFQGSRNDGFPYPYRWTTSYTGAISNFKIGEKGVRYILTSKVFGCHDTTSLLPLAIKGAAGGFRVLADKLCYQSPVTLDDTSRSTPDNTILTRKWDFGDGQTLSSSKGGPIDHTYVNPGNYYVTLQITDAAGCSATIPSSQSVMVKGPKASFYPSGTDVHLSTTVYFYNTTNDNGNTNTAYTWDFGDGSTSNDPYPYHTYTVPGVYTVTMKASNPAVPCGSIATPVKIIVRNFNSNFSFSSAYIAGSCPPLLVNFSNTSYNALSVTWDFGDGNTAGNLNYASHVYEKPGTYIVRLHVNTYNGLTGEYIDSIIIRQPEVHIPKLPPETCIGSNVTLNSSAEFASSYLWDFGDGSLVPSSDGNAVHKYLTAGNYKATLLVQNDAGCLSDTVLPSLVKIRPNPVAALSPTAPVLCLGQSIPLYATGGSTYEWTPAAGLSNPAIANPTAAPVKTTDYLLTVKDDIGCQNTAPLTILVVQPGSLQLNHDTAVCDGQPIKLHATGEMVYKWINYTVGLDHTDIANPTAIAPYTITYTVQGSDDHYCFVHEKSILVTVRPLPMVQAGPDVLVQAGYDATLNTTASNDVISWQWTPEKYLSCYNCAAPLCTPLATTQYVVQVKNKYCKITDTVVVAVDCKEARVRIPNAFTPNNDGSNDVFMIKGISIVKHMMIFNRWGQKVFERDNFIAGDRSSCWDGKLNGQHCLPGAYVYFVEMECPSGGTFSRKGSFVLIR
jgi:gliding motility-associated-like protein